MYSIGGVAGARETEQRRVLHGAARHAVAERVRQGGQNETCATYNLLKLDRQLFMYDQTAKYMDHYEQALYNHILASVAEDDAGNTYHVPLNPGAQKRFGNAEMKGFTCCNGTALESNTKLQDSIYFRSADNTHALRQPVRALDAELARRATSSCGRRPTSRTPTPRRLIMNGSGRFDIRIRVPQWATRGFFVKINGREEAVKAAPGSYLTLARTWRDNDTIELRMPFAFTLEHRGRSAQRRQPLLRSGPARRRGIRAAHRLAAGHARCA